MKANILVGKRITAVQLAEDGKAIQFHVAEGEAIVAKTDGDCCSITWIENVENAEACLGLVISADDIEMPELDYDRQEFDCVAFYGFRIKTSKGECTIDYRNESNGYYGGSLNWPGEHFYGGVYNQNESEEVWKLLAGKLP